MLAWGGEVNLSSADDVPISVERSLHIEAREQLEGAVDACSRQKILRWRRRALQDDRYAAPG